MPKEGRDDLVVKMGQMTVIAKVLKKKFQHLSAEETIKLAGEILIALEEQHDV